MGELYKQILDLKNLELAHRKAARGKRGRSAAAAFEYDLAGNLLALHNELASKTYQPGEYSSFYIHDPKRRLISAAPFRDRVTHHALCNIIEPMFERSFVYDSYANRVGKGTHQALHRAQQFARRFRYVLQIDVEQFFPAIDHLILRHVLARKIRDEDTMWLVDKILASGIGVLAQEYTMRHFPGDDLFAVNRPRGLPIGNLTSQFWANCYLNQFDHFVKRELQCLAYARYVDDALLFGDDKPALWDWREAIVERMGCLRLTIHPGAQPRPVSEGFPFLGFVVYPTHRRLKRRKVVHYRRKLAQLMAWWAKGDLARETVEASLHGWINHVRYGDTWGLRAAIFEQLPPISGAML